MYTTSIERYTEATASLLQIIIELSQQIPEFEYRSLT